LLADPHAPSLAALWQRAGVLLCFMLSRNPALLRLLAPQLVLQHAPIPAGTPPQPAQRPHGALPLSALSLAPLTVPTQAFLLATDPSAHTEGDDSGTGSASTSETEAEAEAVARSGSLVPAHRGIGEREHRSRTSATDFILGAAALCERFDSLRVALDGVEGASVDTWAVSCGEHLKRVGREERSG
jgi:hypothetical protein